MSDTVTRQFAETVASHRDKVALRWKVGDAFAQWTWGEYAERAARLAGALGELGIGHGDRVVLLTRNRPEFHVADVAVMLCGATPISIYNSSAPDQIQYLVGHCGAVAAIVEDGAYLERLLSVRAELPALRTVAIIDVPAAGVPAGVLHWDDLVAHAPVDLDAAAALAKPSDLATVIYTSGTTGPPKGVMLDHANIMWTVECYRATVDVEPGWRTVSYLPMAHIAERMSSHYLGIATAFEVTTCPDPGQVVLYLGSVRPQSFFAVPRVWEKAYASLRAAVAVDPAKAEEFDRALEVGWEVSELRARGAEPTGELAEKFALVEPSLGFVQGLIGLDEAIICVSGAAPIPFEVLRFFRAVGLPLSEIYGLSETSGPMTWEPYKVRIGTVGPPMPGIEVRLDPDGEVCCRGGNVFRGYLDDPVKTAEVLDADGWFHSGDIGSFDDAGYLRIIDRKKELIITAGGKNISPANLESALKSGELIGQACAIGDDRPFVSALIVLDPDAAPSWAHRHGIELPFEELASNPEVLAEVQREVDTANDGFSHVEKIKKFKVLSHEWLPDSDELTPTMKLKRRGVHAKYAAEIEAMYAPPPEK
jgi:long-chain acyl-CoA synthetase